MERPAPPGRLTSTRVSSPGAESTEQVPPSDDAVRTSIVEQWIGIYEITSAFGDGDDPRAVPTEPTARADRNPTGEVGGRPMALNTHRRYIQRCRDVIYVTAG